MSTEGQRVNCLRGPWTEQTEGLFDFCSEAFLPHLKRCLPFVLCPGQENALLGNVAVF